eukprot:CAMPEP_0175824876 /NCGR_PEP_ID=MMETSP0107_2-20121207/10952_1 /TAXON_ID=195067 ORGANISM="Goniomonas pacifica, Strain CCMP1869" /NCGR_SAMPLE_ID=MMETSP0107_2 /ASSEMBLY_ACC=CAM_ASM_000203 /LENGTH=132 /DNA_ID=CAMNT_0017137451 /DNA_START=6 /DNA_END=404 /DNA_ORIENTATION=+
MADRDGYEEEHHPKWAALLILLPPVLPFFYKYSVRLQEGKLSFGYVTGLCSRREVPVHDVQNPHEVEIKGLSEWGGWGIRMGGGKTGYIARDGPGIEYFDKGKNQTYIFSCERPGSFLTALQRAKEQTEGMQ